MRNEHSTRSVMLAGRLWATPPNSGKVMDVEMAMSIAALLDTESDKMFDLLERAMVIICNAGGGDFMQETPDWRVAAKKFLNEYATTISERYEPDCHKINM